MRVLWGDYKSMGTNPASVNMRNGDVVLNMNVFPHLPQFTQKFIVQHELAHYNEQTDSEELADSIALKKLYKTEKQSLKKSVRALDSFLSSQNGRVENIYYESLKLDKMYTNSPLFKNRTHVFPRYMLNADGGEAEAEAGIPTTESMRRSGGKKRFVSIGNLLFTTGELAIFGMLAIIYFTFKKK